MRAVRLLIAPPSSGCRTSVQGIAKLEHIIHAHQAIFDRKIWIEHGQQRDEFNAAQARRDTTQELQPRPGVEDHRAGRSQAFQKRGVRVPEDVSLVGFDDLPTSSYMTPPLTTVRQPTYEIGRLAARGIVQMIRKQPIALSAIPITLVTRETTRRIESAANRGDSRT